MIDFTKAVYDYKLSLILPALEQTEGNVCKAAQLLVLKRTTLIEMMRALKINRAEYRAKKGLAVS